MKKLIFLLLSVTVVGIVSCSRQSDEKTHEDAGEHLLRLKVETGMSDEDFDKALKMWVAHIEAVMELKSDHPLVKADILSVKDLRKQYKKSEKLFKEIAIQKRQLNRFNVIILTMLNENRTEDAKNLLRSRIVEAYRIIKNSGHSDTSGFVDSVDKEAVRDHKLRSLLQKYD